LARRNTKVLNKEPKSKENLRHHQFEALLAGFFLTGMINIVTNKSQGKTKRRSDLLC